MLSVQCHFQGRCTHCGVSIVARGFPAQCPSCGQSTDHGVRGIGRVCDVARCSNCRVLSAAEGMPEGFGWCAINMIGAFNTIAHLLGPHLADHPPHPGMHVAGVRAIVKELRRAHELLPLADHADSCSCERCSR